MARKMLSRQSINLQEKINLFTEKKSKIAKTKDLAEKSGQNTRRKNRAHSRSRTEPSDTGAGSTDLHRGSA